MRLHYIDNIRWVTILLVMLFHVFYYYNAYCAGSGIGGFSDCQPQDAVVYMLYPWLMPLLFVVAYLFGYYIFVRNDVQEWLSRYCLLTIPAALACGIWLTVTTFGQDAYSPAYLRSVGNNLYAWLAILAMFGGFKRWLDRPVVWQIPIRTVTEKTTKTISPAKHSYGLYILQFVVYMSAGYVLRVHTMLPPWAMYVLLFAAMFTLTPALYMIIRRIPVLRWCVLGEK